MRHRPVIIFPVPMPKKIVIRQYSECIDCSGTGYRPVLNQDAQTLSTAMCITCRGTGEVEIE
jgi:DnaJ-class molecular chaperone